MTTRRLLESDSMAASLGLYVPATVLQRLLNLARTVLFIWLMGRAQFGLWGLAMMVFGLGSTVLALGSFNGIARYVSFYQARGQLALLYRATTWPLVLVAVGLTVAATLLAPWLTEAIMGTVAQDTAIGLAERTSVFHLAVVNAVLTALYLNMVAWLRGLRLYRLLSLVEVGYAVLFLLLGAAVLAVRATTAWALTAHAASLAVALAAGMEMLRRATRAPAVPPESLVTADGGSGDARLAPVLQRLLAFSLVALPAGLLWQLQGYVSLWFVQRYHDMDTAGLFQAPFAIGQILSAVALTAWTVVYSHVSVYWERGDRPAARQRLEVTYKAVVLALTAAGILVELTAPWWLAVLPGPFRPSRPLVPWLVMGFLALGNLGYVYVASNLRERPSAWVMTGLVGTVVNVVLAALLVPGRQWLAGAIGGAMATGLAGLACLVAGAAYLLIARCQPSPAALALSFTPALFLLDGLWAALAVAALLVLAVATPLVFAQDEKALVRAAAGRVLRRPKRQG